LTVRSLRNLAAFVGALVASAAPAQTVQTESGAVRGRALEEGGVDFQGIPFASPPLDNLRWKKPMPLARWSGVFDATRPAASCVQNDYGWNHADFLIGREDCLTLDVRTPAISGKRPVLVWIHGGGNYAGSPGGMTLSPLGKDLVLVAVRYRLAIFGFLSHPGLTAEAGASGNYGLMDQIAALQWVKRNIARFGGDPGNITIAGESAGSQDVGLLLAAPAARTLFHKAIMESGTPGFGLPFRTLKDAELLGDQTDDLLGAGGDLAKLRSMSVPALLAVDRQLHDDAIQTDDYKWLRTTIDGAVFPRSPRELLQNAPARPVIIGSNRFELDAPGGRPHRDAFLAKAFGRNAPAARAYYRFDLPEPPPDPRLGTSDQQLGTDVTFRCPAIEMAQLLAAKGAAVWHYEFDAAPGGARSVHAGEIPYFFGDEKLGNGLSLGPYWAQFARTGDPNGSGLPNWPRFTPADQAHVRFDDRGVTPLGPLRPEICSLLDAL
jgi:para-nitrobenzyl esterase